jgi:hypothetical protein
MRNNEINTLDLVDEYLIYCKYYTEELEELPPEWYEEARKSIVKFNAEGAYFSEN